MRLGLFAALAFWGLYVLYGVLMAKDVYAVPWPQRMREFVGVVYISGVMLLVALPAVALIGILTSMTIAFIVCRCGTGDLSTTRATWIGISVCVPIFLFWSLRPLFLGGGPTGTSQSYMMSSSVAFFLVPGLMYLALGAYVGRRFLRELTQRVGNSGERGRGERGRKESRGQSC